MNKTLRKTTRNVKLISAERSQFFGVILVNQIIKKKHARTPRADNILIWNLIFLEQSSNFACKLSSIGYIF